MPTDEKSICDGCGLEFDESELNVDGLCESCAKDFEEFNEDDVVGDDDRIDESNDELPEGRDE